MGSLVSVSGGIGHVHGTFRRDSIGTALSATNTGTWKQCIDYLFEVVSKSQRDDLTEHLNRLDATGSITFSDEPQMDGSILFPDTLISQNDDSSLKIQVYHNIQTDQYLIFTSY